MEHKIPRRIPRRDVLAFIAVHSTDATAPHMVRFEEYVDHGEQWHVVALVVADEAAVRFWADIFGHHPDQLHREDRPAGTAGRSRPCTFIDSMADGWWGLTTDVTATVDHPHAADAPVTENTENTEVPRPVVLAEAA
jgi:hypothetical protein